MWRLTVIFALVIAACGGAAEPSAVLPAAGGPVRSFSYVALDGTVVDSASTRGRTTVVLFFTSYDPMCIMVARRLEELRRQSTPRINALAVAAEPPKNAPLVDTFHQTLGLGYPVTMADRGTLSGSGPLGVIRGVPTLVVLDRAGRETWRAEGVPAPGALEEAVAKTSQRNVR